MDRFALAIVLVALSACDTSHEISRIDAGTDAGRDADLADLDATDMVTFRAREAELSTCNCHHGCAPGIDGTFVIDVTNTTLVPRALTITRVTIDSIGSPSGPFTTPDDGHFLVANTAADGSVTIAAGTTVSVSVTVYLDVPAVDPGTDVVTIEGTTEGIPAGEIAHFANVAVTMAPGC